MDVWLPYIDGMIGVATRVCLLTTLANVHYARITDPMFGYHAYFAERWAAGRGFVNVEQDVVWWHGALDAMWWGCNEPWCAYAYWTGEKPYLGCVKFSTAFIEATPDMWACDPIPFTDLELRLEAVAQAAGFSVHQHEPCVVNANPVLVANMEAP